MDAKLGVSAPLRAELMHGAEPAIAVRVAPVVAAFVTWTKGGADVNRFVSPPCPPEPEPGFFVGYGQAGSTWRTRQP